MSSLIKTVKLRVEWINYALQFKINSLREQLQISHIHLAYEFYLVQITNIESRSKRDLTSNLPIQIQLHECYINIQIETKSLIAKLDVNKESNYIPLKILTNKIINDNFNRLIILTTKIALQEINIEYVITLNNEIILGKEFLEKVKPWKIDQDYFEFTYNQTQSKTRIINE